MDVMHCLLASDRYALHFCVKRERWHTQAEALFVCVDPGHTTVLQTKERSFFKRFEENVWFSGRKCEMSLLPEKEIRFVGHVDDFVNGDGLLVDVQLKLWGMENGMRRYTADGIMVMGEEEFVFAPAHSAALIWKETEDTVNRMVSVWMFAKQPCVFVHEEESDGSIRCHSVPAVPFIPNKVEALTDQRNCAASAALIRGVLKDFSNGTERSIHPLIAIRT